MYQPQDQEQPNDGTNADILTMTIEAITEAASDVLKARLRNLVDTELNNLWQNAYDTGYQDGDLAAHDLAYQEGYRDGAIAVVDRKVVDRKKEITDGRNCAGKN